MAATISPSAIIEGVVVAKTGKYRLVVRPLECTAVPLTVSHDGSLESSRVVFYAPRGRTPHIHTDCDSNRCLGGVPTHSGIWHGFAVLNDGEKSQVFSICTNSYLFSHAQFMVLAPLSVSENAAAVALLTFFRTFSQARFSYLLISLIQLTLEILGLGNCHCWDYLAERACP